MQVQEHAQTAQKSLAKADHEFMAGNLPKASKELWIAAVYAVKSVAQQRGWPHADREDFGRVVDRLSEETDDRYFTAGFGVAGKFHANSELDFMEEYEFDLDRRFLRDYVSRLITLCEEAGS